MDNITEKPWFTWMEGALQAMYESDPACMMFAARLPDGNTMTAYYNTDNEDIAVMVSHVQNDMILDFIEVNADIIKEMLEGDEEE